MSFFEVLLGELKAVFNNRVVLLIVLGGSLLYALLYPTPYHNDVIREQKIAVVDHDESAFSRELLFFVNAVPQLRVAYVLGSEKHAKDLLLENKIFGYLSIPRGFEANVYKGVPTYLGYVANASYFSVYGAIIEGLNHAGSALSDVIKIHAKTLQDQHTQKEANLLSSQSIPLFNVSGGYLNYALAAILIFILHQTAIGGAMLVGAFQNKENDPLAYYNQASSLQIIAARFLVFGVIYCLLFALFFGFFFEMYHVSIQANEFDFWCFAFALIFATLALGILLGLLIKDTALPTQIVLVSSLPIVFVLGFIWPSDLIPEFLKFFANFIPAYHGINGFLRLNQMGAQLLQIMPQFYWLMGFGSIFSLLAIWIKARQQYRIKMQKS